jgi:hypothetical protein
MPALLLALAVASLAFFDNVPGAKLPVVKTHEYVMSGAVRPLLFWIGRDDIGTARITWRAHPSGAKGYELLVGTDPARAPRGINRWGLITEETAKTGGAVLAFMTGSNETSYQKEASAAGSGAGDFHMIQSRTAGQTATWQLSHLRTPDALTVYQVAELLDFARRSGTSAGPERRRALPANVRSGFLVATAEMLEQIVAGAAAGKGTPSAAPIQYAFGSHTYELRLRDAHRVSWPQGPARVAALRVRFETKALDTGDTSSFDVTAGAAGEMAGVPLQIEWQPRWWLRVRLQLATPGNAGL